MDLYTQLEELQGMTGLLIEDVAMLKPKIGEGNDDPPNEEKANRRFYIRAVFALVEAFVEQHRRLLVHLCQSGKIELKERTLNRLREIKHILNENGVVVGEEPRFMQMFDKIEVVYNAAAIGFGQPLTVDCGDQRWPIFKSAMETRNQITHPKSVQDCWIFEQDLQNVIAAHEWFRALQNEFVRVAREHRDRNRGLPTSW